MNSKAYLETRILSADPVELISLFYEYAILSVQEARDHLARRNIAERSKAIVRAIRIVGELEGALDHSVGGEISANLARLYKYIRAQLMIANAKQQDQPLADVESLLQTLAEGWKGVSESRKAEVPEAGSLVQWSTPFSIDPLGSCAAHSWSA
jgi:flagellar protein FliS